MPRSTTTGRVASSTRTISSALDLLPVLYCRADQGITIATGVSQWNDLSGNANHLLQATANRQPLFVASANNSQPAVRLDGVNDYLKTASFTLNQPETVMMVFRSVVIGVSSLNDAIFDGDATASMVCLSDTVPTFYINAGSSISYAGNVANNAYVLLTAVFNIDGSSITVTSASARTTVASGSVGTNNAGGFTLGSLGGVARYTNIEVAEIVILNRVIADGELTKYESYVRNRYTLA